VIGLIMENFQLGGGILPGKLTEFTESYQHNSITDHCYKIKQGDVPLDYSKLESYACASIGFYPPRSLSEQAKIDKF
jgi:hypothetical protein